MGLFPCGIARKAIRMMAMQQPGPWLTWGPWPGGLWARVGHGQPSKGHVGGPSASHCGDHQGRWILTGVRVDVPEPGSEECPDEEGAEGDAQDGGQPQTVICSRMRPSAPPHWGEGLLPTSTPAPAPSLAPNSLLGGRQLSFTVTSRTFSKMVLFCGGGGGGEGWEGRPTSH